MPNDVSIVGRKVRLRAVGAGDVDHQKIVGWRNDPDISRWFFSNAEVTLESHLGWYERASDDPTQLYLGIEALVLPGSDKPLGAPLLIGTVGLVDIDTASGQAEFGRLMIGDPDLRCCGYAKEAAYLLLDYAVHSLGLESMYADVLATNEPALALYAGLGFHLTQVRLDPVRKDDVPVEAVRLRLKAADLRARADCLCREFDLPARIAARPASGEER